MRIVVFLIDQTSGLRHIVLYVPITAIIQPVLSLRYISVVVIPSCMHHYLQQHKAALLAV